MSQNLKDIVRGAIERFGPFLDASLDLEAGLQAPIETKVVDDGGQANRSPCSRQFVRRRRHKAVPNQSLESLGKYKPFLWRVPLRSPNEVHRIAAVRGNFSQETRCARLSPQERFDPSRIPGRCRSQSTNPAQVSKEGLLQLQGRGTTKSANAPISVCKLRGYCINVPCFRRQHIPFNRKPGFSVPHDRSAFTLVAMMSSAVWLHRTTQQKNLVRIAMLKITRLR